MVQRLNDFAKLYQLTRPLVPDSSQGQEGLNTKYKCEERGNPAYKGHVRMTCNLDSLAVFLSTI